MVIDPLSTSFPPEEVNELLTLLYKMYHGHDRKLDETGRRDWTPYLTKYGFLGLGYVIRGIVDSPEMRDRVREELNKLWSEGLGVPPTDQDVANYKETLSFFREAGKEEILARIARAEEVSQQASDAIRDGRFADAQRILEVARPEVIPHFRFWHEHGLSLRRQGRNEEAIESYKHAIELNARNDQFFLWSCEDLKWCYHELGEKDASWYTKGYEYFHSLSSKQPTRWPVWHEYGWMASHLDREDKAKTVERYHEAIKNYKQAIDLIPVESDWGWSCTDLLNCFTTLAEQPETQTATLLEAYEYFCHLTKTRPNLWGAWHARGWLEWKCFDVLNIDRGLAVGSYRQAVETRADGGWFWSWYDLGSCLMETGQLDEAYKAYQGAKNVESNRHSWHGLGMVAEKRQDWNEAANCYLEAIRLDPKSSRSWFGLGTSYTHQSRYVNAWEAYQQALMIEPNITSFQQAVDELGRRPWIELLERMSSEMTPDDIEKVRFKLGGIDYSQLSSMTTTPQASRLIELCQEQNRIGQLLRIIRETNSSVLQLVLDSNEAKSLDKKGRRASGEWRTKLRAIISGLYTQDKFQLLCHDLEVSIHNIPGETLDVKEANLIDLLNREGRLQEFVQAVLSQHPHLTDLESEFREANLL